MKREDTFSFSVFIGFFIAFYSDNSVSGICIAVLHFMHDRNSCFLLIPMCFLLLAVYTLMFYLNILP